MIKDKSSYHILVIEDNPGDYTLIEEFLEEQIESPVIYHAPTFKKARAFLSDPPSELQVILLDLSLPDKSGEDLIVEIKSLSQDVPVIVLTGFSDISFGIKSLSLGVSDYLLKDDLTPVLLFKNIIYNIERKKINLELEASRKRYSDLFHLSPLPMWVYDISNFRFLDVNEAACIHYSYSRQEFLQMTIKDIRPEEDIPLLEDSLKNTLNTPSSRPTSSGFFRHVKKNKEVIHVEIKGSNLVFAGKQARLILANDITDRLTYINTIEQQNQKLREIAWVQSHLVRAPLAKILAAVEFLKDPDDYGMSKSELLETVEASANELDEIIRDISKKTNEMETPDNTKDNK